MRVLNKYIADGTVLDMKSIEFAVKSMEDRTAKLIFKLAVEMSMMMK